MVRVGKEVQSWALHMHNEEDVHWQGRIHGGIVLGRMIVESSSIL